MASRKIRPEWRWKNTGSVFTDIGIYENELLPGVPQMLEALKAQHRFVEISRTEADCREEFYFGRIRETTERAVTLDIFDELGGWTDEPLRIPYEKSARWPSACARWNCSAATAAEVE